MSDASLGDTVARMVDDPDIWRMAVLLVKRYKADAPIVAAERADALFDEGDLECARAWWRIVDAIAELARLKPAEGERVN